jgi:hypothetical protein
LKSPMRVEGPERVMKVSERESRKDCLSSWRHGP